MAYIANWLEDGNATLLKVKRHRDEGRLFPPSNSSLQAIVDAIESRKKMRRWAETPEASLLGLDYRVIPMLDWWTELPKYRFLLSPMGSAIQTAKTIEALLVGTVPI